MQGTSSDCPHCGTTKTFFGFKAQFPSQIEKRNWYVLATCEVCKDAVLFTFYDLAGRGVDPIQIAKNGNFDENFEVRRQIPEAKQPRIASNVPDNVKLPLIEAEKAFAAGLYSASGSCYRKSVERAVKAIDENLSGMLNKRIRSLEKSGMLPKAMIELLDQVRLFGNSSMHEDDDDPTKEDCSAARDFCDLFLTYAFSLPAKVEAAKAKATETLQA